MPVDIRMAHIAWQWGWENVRWAIPHCVCLASYGVKWYTLNYLRLAMGHELFITSVRLAVEVKIWDTFLNSAKGLHSDYDSSFRCVYMHLEFDFLLFLGIVISPTPLTRHSGAPKLDCLCIFEWIFCIDFLK